jgi:hypothetical protein
VSARAQAQINDVAKALRSLSSPQLANDQGFAPVLGWVPTMGVHWVNDARMVDGKNFDALLPDQLMFSRVNGKETVVGAAYAYLTALSDTARPATFDGNPPWHEHPNLAPEGQTLVMLHIWFVPSPDGPFAGHNPNLPFWALGLTPPAEAKFREGANAARTRKAATCDWPHSSQSIAKSSGHWYRNSMPHKRRGIGRSGIVWRNVQRQSGTRCVLRICRSHRTPRHGKE